MIQVYLSRLVSRILAPIATISALSLLLSGCGGAHFNAAPAPTVTIAGQPHFDYRGQLVHLDRDGG